MKANMENKDSGKMSQVSHVERSKSDSEQVENIHPSYIPGTDEEKKLVRKIDTFLMPCIFLMYLLSYMDRTNIGNAKVAGMETDLNLDSVSPHFL